MVVLRPTAYIIQALRFWMRALRVQTKNAYCELNFWAITLAPNKNGELHIRLDRRFILYWLSFFAPVWGPLEPGQKTTLRQTKFRSLAEWKSESRIKRSASRPTIRRATRSAFGRRFILYRLRALPALTGHSPTRFMFLHYLPSTAKYQTRH